ncbi:ferredoxin [Brevibacillus parabrevis]|uniref:2Fe-2S iron-sulfur cluster-binding protein n=1 Tax=Brevibacillus parabrevis TaxID=54914 RepID=UPI0007ABEDFB|nr:2Fe-2S iron-sulfur cluster-binding protein [Brevibacillus parabrevis]KZE49402.1 ferredoxin [Brevibacillus parabrevis]
MRKQLTVGSLIAGRSPVQQLVYTPVHTNLPESGKQADSRFFAKPNKQNRPIPTAKARQKQVQIKQNSRAFTIGQAPYQTLLQAAQAQGQSISYKCQQGYCGKCSVMVVSGNDLLTAPTRQEHEKLDKKLSAGYRLACQSTFRSPTSD